MRKVPFVFPLVLVAGVLSPGLFGVGATQAGSAVDIRSTSYAPRDLTVAVGDTVTWTNHDPFTHSVSADDGSFDSHPRCAGMGGRCLKPDESFSHTFERPGRFLYHCRIHGAPEGNGMSGTVTVLPGRFSTVLALAGPHPPDVTPAAS